jgi:hypothetical protein
MRVSCLTFVNKKHKLRNQIRGLCHVKEDSRTILFSFKTGCDYIDDASELVSIGLRQSDFKLVVDKMYGPQYCVTDTAYRCK